MIPNVWNRGSALRSPVDALMDVRREFDRLLGDWGDGWTEGLHTWPAEVYETTDELQFRLEAPGMKADDFDISIENNVLTVTGERKFERKEGEEGEYRVFERRYGRFQRSFVLPNNVDPEQVHARYTDGVLSITLPKREESKPRRIRIESGSQRQEVPAGTGRERQDVTSGS